MKSFLTYALTFSLAVSAHAAWYQDRDNSMSDANDEVGDAMAIVLGPNGTATQAIQVCSGVYLATAHGALDSPIIAKENDRKLMAPGTLTKFIAYPMVKENLMRQRDSSKYISPRLRTPSLWEEGNQDSDYVFIKIDNPVRPNSYVTPLSVTSEEVVKNKDSVSVDLYRGESRYKSTNNNGINYNEDQAIPQTDTKALMTIYNKPKKLNTPCAILRVNSNSDSYVDHNCPTENSVSGSPYASNIGGKNYIVGLETRGADVNITSSKDAGGSTMLTSSSFCADYQTVCGKPCPKFEDVFDAQDE